MLLRWVGVRASSMAILSVIYWASPRTSNSLCALADSVRVSVAIMVRNNLFIAVFFKVVMKYCCLSLLLLISFVFCFLFLLFLCFFCFLFLLFLCFFCFLFLLSLVSSVSYLFCFICFLFLLILVSSVSCFLKKNHSSLVFRQ